MRKKIIVERSKWDKGSNKGQLVDQETRQYCILAFVGEQVYGLSWLNMSPHITLGSAIKRNKGDEARLEMSENFPTNYLAWEVKMFQTNDDSTLDQGTKEEALKVIAAEAEFELIFQGE